MDLQEAIIQVVEEWREKRGMTKIQLGMAIFPASPEPRVAGDKWNHIVKGRNTTNKKRQLTIDELDKLADFFGYLGRALQNQLKLVSIPPPLPDGE